MGGRIGLRPVTPAREPPLWDDCDAKVTGGVPVELAVSRHAILRLIRLNSYPLFNFTFASDADKPKTDGRKTLSNQLPAYDRH